MLSKIFIKDLENNQEVNNKFSQYSVRYQLLVLCNNKVCSIVYY